jgi:peptide/nickel transport system ATP-binding protein
MSGTAKLDAAPPLLAIENLAVGFSTRRGMVEAVRGVSLSVTKGEVLGIVGESGSGKSVTAFSVMRLLDRAGRITGGTIKFRGNDITRLGASDLRRLRGAAMAMIFQNPRASLNPIRQVGDQIADALCAHRDVSRTAARAKALDLLKAVLIREPEKRLTAYPHELSGGMCQRVMMAMAMACEPDLLIADEPTTGLDVTTQKTVMDQLAGLVRERGMAMILITHDLGLASQYCDRVAVMEQGLVVETAAPADLFSRPQHAYTRRLVAASPTPTSTVESLSPEGERASAKPPTTVIPGLVPGTHSATNSNTSVEARWVPAINAGITSVRLNDQGPLMAVEDLVMKYDGNITAVDHVSFEIRPGESLGLVGESGSGKSTISRIVCRLIDPTSGAIRFAGADIGSTPARGFHKSPYRSDIQIVFQDPGDSLNPRFSAFDSIADPLRRLKGLGDAKDLRARVLACAARCGLQADLIDRFPHQLSGGQRARVGIARAIAAEPKLLVLDEPTAALDVSVQAVILQLLDRLRREAGMAYLFVSHDLNVIRMMCERTIVLKEGRIVEQGSSRALFANPADAYTRALIAAIPHFEPGRAAKPVP